MLIRKPGGNTFHIVTGETQDQHFFVCLCGLLVEKDSLVSQTVAEWPYSRCWTCRKLQNDRLKAIYNRKF